jgi:P-type E1-E2 ATPase
MITISIPTEKELQLEHLVLDVNGTLAVDGELLPGVPDLLAALSQQVKLHLLTADTHGKQAMIDRKLNLKALRIKPGDEAGQKAAYVRDLGASRTAAIGQGANDALMLAEAVIGICTLAAEGAAVQTMLKADVVAPDIQSALNLLLHPNRLVATLRK